MENIKQQTSQDNIVDKQQEKKGEKIEELQMKTQHVKLVYQNKNNGDIGILENDSQGKKQNENKGEEIKELQMEKQHVKFEQNEINKIFYEYQNEFSYSIKVLGEYSSNNINLICNQFKKQKFKELILYIDNIGADGAKSLGQGLKELKNLQTMTINNPEASFGVF